MKKEFSPTRRGKLAINLTMIALSVGLVVGFQALRVGSTTGSSSVLVPEI